MYIYIYMFACVWVRIILCVCIYLYIYVHKHIHTPTYILSDTDIYEIEREMSVFYAYPGLMYILSDTTTKFLLLCSLSFFEFFVRLLS